MRLGLLVVVLSCVLLAGCGPKKVAPSGQVYKDGKPWKLSDKGMFIITLVADSDTTGKNRLPVDTKPDGSFVVVGKDRKGVPVGKYKVAIQAMDPYGPNGKDLLEGKYAADKSNLTVEVGGGEVKIEIPK